MSLVVWLATQQASAFCGFYVGGAESSLYNDATMVVLLRSGTTTALSMQNSYQGPPEGFAMVVPVPQVLQKDNVKILPRDVFAHVDTLAAPRLVEYWEQDPCYVPPPLELESAPPSAPLPAPLPPARDGVKIEARFEVGEYDVVILSASDSSGLDRWLRREKYNIPAGAEPVLRPYVEAGTKFFVAKVLPEKVTFVDGRAVLSPLRVHYDSQDFSLPVRLGLLNSQGEQDLIVHILAPQQRFEVANYNNAFVPTNLRVRDEVRNNFGAFYDAVFREVAQPGTVVTEYAWDAGSCDPCPQPPLTNDDIATLGGDVVGNTNTYDYVLTRLHYRYGKEGLKEDLVFKGADPIMGGIGMPAPDGSFPTHSAEPSPHQNMFQGRYIILHPWQGEMVCETPNRGRWGGPLRAPAPGVESATSRLTTPAAPAAPVALASVLVDGFGSVTPTPAPSPAPAPAPSHQQRWCSIAPSSGGWLAASLLALLVRRR